MEEVNYRSHLRWFAAGEGSVGGNAAFSDSERAKKRKGRAPPPVAPTVSGDAATSAESIHRRPGKRAHQGHDDDDEVVVLEMEGGVSAASAINGTPPGAKVAVKHES